MKMTTWKKKKKPLNRCHQWHEQRCIQYPTSCCPSGAHPLSTRRLWLWGKRGGDTLRPPHPPSGSLWTSSRVGGWSQAGRLREQTRVKAICLALWRGNSCASAEMSSASPAITGILFRQQTYWLIVWKNYANERARPWLSEELGQPLFTFSFTWWDEALPFQWQHNVHTVCVSHQFSSLWMIQSRQTAYLQPWAQRWRRGLHAHCLPRTDTSQSRTDWSWIWSIYLLPHGFSPENQVSWLMFGNLSQIYFNVLWDEWKLLDYFCLKRRNYRWKIYILFPKQG